MGRGEKPNQSAAASNGLIRNHQSDEGTYQPTPSGKAKKATLYIRAPGGGGGGPPNPPPKSLPVTPPRSSIVRRALPLDFGTGNNSAFERTDAGGIWSDTLVAGGNLLLVRITTGTTSVILLGLTARKLP